MHGRYNRCSLTLHHLENISLASCLLVYILDNFHGTLYGSVAKLIKLGGTCMKYIYRTESNYERNREKHKYIIECLSYSRPRRDRSAVSIISNVYPSRTSPYWSHIIIEGSETLLKINVSFTFITNGHLFELSKLPLPSSRSLSPS